MSVSRIRGFLLKLPKPTTVIAHVDGERNELNPSKSFARCAETIAALGADLVECLDKDGKILRAMRFGAADAQRSDAAAIPSGIETDPQALMLTHFANLLHRAYEHSTEIAFAKFVEVFEIHASRSDAIEQRLERTESANRRMMREQLDNELEHADELRDAAAAAEASGEGPLAQQMLGAFLQGQMMTPKPPKPASSTAPKTETKSNGKG
jgi:hypothetical protein